MTKMIDGLVAPGASNEYRQAREKLLIAEKNVLQQLEQVAQMRRELPQGPEVSNYEFTGRRRTGSPLATLQIRPRAVSRDVPLDVLGG